MLLLSGCSIMNLTSSNHPTPPLQVTFRGGYELIGEFTAMLEKDEKEIEEYLKKNNYHANGVNTIGDMEAFLATLSETYFPVMKEANVTGITIYTGRDEMEVFYETMDGTRYVFDISIKPDTAEEDFQSCRAQSKGKFSENINKKTDDIKIYAYTRARGEIDMSPYFFMDVRGVSVGARTHSDADTSVIADILQNTKFLKLDEILQNLPELKNDSSGDSDSQSYPSD